MTRPTTLSLSPQDRLSRDGVEVPGLAAGFLYAERERIAAGLSDGLVHTLFAVGLDLHVALAFLDRSPTALDADCAADRIRLAIDSLDQVINDIRTIVFDLRST